MVFDLLQTLLAAGLSQAEISRRTGIPAPSIHRLLNGKQVEVVYSHGKALERAVAQLNNPTDGLPPEVANQPAETAPAALEAAPAPSRPTPATPLAPTLGEPRLGSDRRDDERRKPDPRAADRREDERRQEVA